MASRKSDEPGKVAGLSFAEASAELDAIIVEFETGSVDVDRLVSQLERATAIVDELDGRLRATALRVDEITPRLEAIGSTDVSPRSEDEAGDGDSDGATGDDGPQGLF